MVIGADGVRSFVAKEVEAQEEQQEEVSRAMYFAYYKDVTHNEGPAAEFHYHGNNIGYVMPTDGELTLLAVSVPISRFGEFKRNPEGELLKELASMVDIAPRMTNVKRESKVLGTGSISCYMRIPYGPGWALVGDASLALDPWSGQGIDQGSSHAVMLGKHMGDYLSGTKEWNRAMGDYHVERNEFSEKAYRRTAKFAPDLRPMTAGALAKRGLK